jgi:hypothetical protein
MQRADAKTLLNSAAKPKPWTNISALIGANDGVQTLFDFLSIAGVIGP